MLPLACTGQPELSGITDVNDWRESRSSTTTLSRGGSAAISSRTEKRFLFYSHDGLGLGHVRRNLAIAAALAEIEPNAAILIATSADEVAELGVPEQVDVLKLPGLRKIS